MPIVGKDFKTGQTLVKSGFAPIIGTRCLGLNGWFSTNILGNRDGLVLDEPQNFHTKEVSKLSTLETILKGENQPELYGDYYHKVRINYYPPRNDNKESWDNIDIFGWMGLPHCASTSVCSAIWLLVQGATVSSVSSASS